MRTYRAVTRISSEPVAMRPIVNRMTRACENITFPCGQQKRGVQNSLEVFIQRQTPTQIPVGFCANLSVSVYTNGVFTPSDTETDKETNKRESIPVRCVPTAL